MPEELAGLYKNSDEVATSYTLRAMVTGRLIVQLLSGAGGMKPRLELAAFKDAQQLSACFLKADDTSTWIVLDTHAGDLDDWTRVWMLILDTLGKGGLSVPMFHRKRGVGSMFPSRLRQSAAVGNTSGSRTT